MTEDVVGIVGGLSEAARGIMAAHGDTRHAFYPGRRHRACVVLGSSGLLAETADNIGNQMWRYSVLGLAVRAHLLKGECDEQ